jgi:hypothetical protein
VQGSPLDPEVDVPILGVCKEGVLDGMRVAPLLPPPRVVCMLLARRPLPRPAPTHRWGDSQRGCAGVPCCVVSSAVIQESRVSCQDCHVSYRFAEQPLLLLSTISSNFHRQCNSPRLVGSFRFYPCQRRCIKQCFRMFSTTQASSSHTTHRVAPPAGSLAGWPMSGVWATSHPTYRNTIFHSR